MIGEDNDVDRLSWARRIWRNIPYSTRYEPYAAIRSVQKSTQSNIREIWTWPERIEFLECTKCGCNACSGTPGWYRCRLCGAPAFRRVQLRDGRIYSWPWPPEEGHAKP